MASDASSGSEGGSSSSSSSASSGSRSPPSKRKRPSKKGPSEKSKKKDDSLPSSSSPSASSSSSSSSSSSGLEDGEFFVERVLDTKVEHGKRLYKLKWRDYPMSACTWECVDDMNCDDLIDDFWKTKNRPPPKNAKRAASKKKKRPRRKGDDDENWTEQDEAKKRKSSTGKKRRSGEPKKRKVGERHTKGSFLPRQGSLTANRAAESADRSDKSAVVYVDSLQPPPTEVRVTAPHLAPSLPEGGQQAEPNALNAEGPKPPLIDKIVGMRSTEQGVELGIQWFATALMFPHLCTIVMVSLMHFLYFFFF